MSGAGEPSSRSPAAGRKRRRRTIDRWLLATWAAGGLAIPAGVIGALRAGYFPPPAVVWAAALGVVAAFLVAVLLSIEDAWLARKEKGVRR